jgi:hypothetical protein
MRKNAEQGLTGRQSTSGSEFQDPVIIAFPGRQNAEEALNGVQETLKRGSHNPVESHLEFAKMVKGAYGKPCTHQPRVSRSVTIRIFRTPKCRTVDQ